jgi:signal peptidase I
MKFRWFLSRQYRLTADLVDAVQKRRRAQYDLLTAAQLEMLDDALRETIAVLDTRADDVTLAHCAQKLDALATQLLQPYPHAIARDNIETLLVVIALAMCVRTFFFQPFHIPTGSMQPTLYGITSKNLRDDTKFAMPGFWPRVFAFVAQGTIYHETIAQDDGQFDHAGRLEKFGGILNRQTFWVRYRSGNLVPITMWAGPDESQFDSVEHRLGLVDQFNERQSFKKGEPIIRFAETAGDYLIVDRFTYNFRRPERGEIIVFNTGHVPRIGKDEFYIKRLIGLPGDYITIGDDRHVRINGLRLDDKTPHFQSLYGFDPATPPSDSHYSGHVLDWQSRMKTSEDTLVVGKKEYAVFGDNTVNSSDSRYWGGFPEEDLMGRACFVYWPLTERFGFATVR